MTEWLEDGFAYLYKNHPDLMSKTDAFFDPLGKRVEACEQCILEEAYDGLNFVLGEDNVAFLADAAVSVIEDFMDSTTEGQRQFMETSIVFLLASKILTASLKGAVASVATESLTHKARSACLPKSSLAKAYKISERDLSHIDYPYTERLPFHKTQQLQKTGVAAFIPEKAKRQFFDTREYYGRPEGIFVLSYLDAQSVLKATKGDRFKIQRHIGVEWEDEPLYLLRVDNPAKYKPRKPVGAMEGANKHFQGDGYVPGGCEEFIIDRVRTSEIRIDKI